LGKVKEVEERWQSIVDKVKRKKSVDTDASKKLVDLLEEYLK
jgi:hypothetical protein